MDGITIRALCELWNQQFANARIDKIHQPTDRDIVLTVRTRSGTSRLIMSANRMYPRAHELFIAKPVNPPEPKMFCMMMRKRIESGRIVCVRQQGWDRVIEMVIENYTEIGDLVKYVLVLEVMGKHSNLMFCTADADGRPVRILDSVIHVTPDMSRVRTVLPGLSYQPAPAQDKVSPLNVTSEDIKGIDDLADTTKASRWLCTKVAGLGPVTAREAIYRASLKGHDLASLVATEINHLFRSVSTSETFASSIGLDNLGRPIVAVPYELTSYEQKKSSPNVSHALDELYHELLGRTSEVNTTTAKDVEISVLDSIDKLTGKLTNLRAEFEESKNHDTYRIKGELLTSYAYMVNKGVTEVRLPNYYNDEQIEVIEVDPALTAIENAQKYFKQASKRKRAAATLDVEIARVEDDLRYLEDVRVHLHDSTATILDDIRRELVHQGFMRQSSKRKLAKSTNPKPAKPDVYLASDGTRIYVGRNNTQNDRLTLKSSRPDDIWLHVKDTPGSHVVIAASHSTITSETLSEAALLAAYFSKARDSANVPVDHTAIKNVWKPKGARPGLVLYDSQKTIYVTPNRQLIEPLMQRKE